MRPDSRRSPGGEAAGLQSPRLVPELTIHRTAVWQARKSKLLSSGSRWLRLKTFCTAAFLPPPGPAQKPTHLCTHLKVNMHKSRIQGWGGKASEVPLWVHPAPELLPTPGKATLDRLSLSHFEECASSLEPHTCFAALHSTRFRGPLHQFSFPKAILHTSELGSEGTKA